MFLSLFPFYLNYLSVSLSRVCAPTLPLTNNTGSRVSLKRGPLPGWPAGTREQMISGSPEEREDREVEAERDKFKSTRPAPDKLERAPSGALSPEIERHKGDDPPLSLNEKRNSSRDKCVPSQPEDTNSLKVTTMHSESESTFITLRADKLGSTLPPVDKRAQDKQEGGEEDTIPPPLFKKGPEDNDGVDWSNVTDPGILAQVYARQIKKKERKEAEAARKLSSSAYFSVAKPKKINQTKKEE